ncbi:ABC transporter ATP-binding protein [Candidatus Nitrosoglobus terrae]|uniref:ABC transporter ATP-binding protein n=1 Tax=Candidatus Nitrosoglobus terrae TaxID=1630141 RepID=A0A1Q2SK91_9GAMM|nr:ABC transporter ATP-binding protein [Candidatus Nitrosoglobus terrae]BAW79537.1 ABC transporter ATP-binding protein [Candidatus Nitrosoglobus terrae]
MVPKLLVKLDQVSKVYPKLSTSRDRLQAFWAILKNRQDYSGYSVLQEISLHLYQGESLGIIGENGAGKSTLLKHIAGVVKPSRGTVEVFGRIGALLELGAGFHPEYSGRENLRLSAALMGMSDSELIEKLDAIIEFADIGAYIDEPIKHYSSGMVVRLGFALVSALRPELLITDEVLAVGDESFQKKCIRWIENYLNQGGTLLLCSHSMFHVQKLCQKAAWIKGGRLVSCGEVFQVTQDYLAYHEGKSQQEAVDSLKKEQISTALYRVSALRISGAAGEELALIAMGEDLIVNGELYSPDDRPPVVAIGVVRTDGAAIYGLISDVDGFTLNKLAPHQFGFRLTFFQLPLLPGKYTLRAHAMDPEGLRLFDTIEQAFQVTGQTRELGLCCLAHAWASP